MIWRVHSEMSSTPDTLRVLLSSFFSMAWCKDSESMVSGLTDLVWPPKFLRSKQNFFNHLVTVIKYDFTFCITNIFVSFHNAGTHFEFGSFCSAGPHFEFGSFRGAGPYFEFGSFHSAGPHFEFGSFHSAGPHFKFGSFHSAGPPLWIWFLPQRWAPTSNLVPSAALELSLNSQSISSRIILSCTFIWVAFESKMELINAQRVSVPTTA